MAPRLFPRRDEGLRLPSPEIAPSPRSSASAQPRAAGRPKCPLQVSSRASPSAAFAKQPGLQYYGVGTWATLKRIRRLKLGVRRGVGARDFEVDSLGLAAARTHHTSGARQSVRAGARTSRSAPSLA